MPPTGDASFLQQSRSANSSTSIGRSSEAVSDLRYSLWPYCDEVVSQGCGKENGHEFFFHDHHRCASIIPDHARLPIVELAEWVLRIAAVPESWAIRKLLLRQYIAVTPNRADRRRRECRSGTSASTVFSPAGKISSRERRLLRSSPTLTSVIRFQSRCRLPGTDR